MVKLIYYPLWLSNYDITRYYANIPPQLDTVCPKKTCPENPLI